MLISFYVSVSFGFIYNLSNALSNLEKNKLKRGKIVPLIKEQKIPKTNNPVLFYA